MEKLIVALDLPDYPQCVELVDKLGDKVTWYKIGSVLFTKCGPPLVEWLRNENKKVMLDLKYHDIPNTVEKACFNACYLGANMLTVHLSGGLAMLKAARKGIYDANFIEAVKRSQDAGTVILGISMLTSIDQQVLNEELNIDDTIENRVSSLVELAGKAGINGIVCSAKETKGLREKYPELIIVNPGIRMAGTDKSDQKRVTTPKQAFDNGASFIVMGRGVYGAADPVAVVTEIEESVNG